MMTDGAQVVWNGRCHFVLFFSPASHGPGIIGQRKEHAGE